MDNCNNYIINNMDTCRPFFSLFGVDGFSRVVSEQQLGVFEMLIQFQKIFKRFSAASLNGFNEMVYYVADTIEM